MPAGEPAVRVTRVLHCNLNARRADEAVAVYEQGLALVTRMESRPVGADATPLAVDGPVDSDVRFLYDHRGGRVGPAIELMEWLQPRTAGEVSDDPRTVGMRALGFEVPSVAGALTALAEAGARPLAWRSTAVDAVALDADGVRIELVEEPATTASTLAYARLNCADLERTTRWYEAIGLARGGPAVVESWSGDELPDGPATVPVERLTAGDDSGFELWLSTWPGTDPVGRAPATANHRGLYRVAFAVDDVRAAVEHARADGRVEVSDPSSIPLPGTPVDGLWIAFLRDPDGVTVQFVERS